MIGARFQVSGPPDGLVVSWLMHRFNRRVAVVGSYTLGVVGLISLSRLPGSEAAFACGLFMAWFITSGSRSSMLTLAAALHPTVVRSGGVIWMPGVGRFGAILDAFAGLTRLGLGLELTTLLTQLAAISALAATCMGRTVPAMSDSIDSGHS